MKQAGTAAMATSKELSDVSEYIWETFDSLFKTVGRQGRRVEELEARIADLERRLSDAGAGVTERPQTKQQPLGAINEMPAERAA